MFDNSKKIYLENFLCVYVSRRNNLTYFDETCYNNRLYSSVYFKIVLISQKRRSTGKNKLMLMFYIF